MVANELEQSSYRHKKCIQLKSKDRAEQRKREREKIRERERRRNADREKKEKEIKGGTQREREREREWVRLVSFSRVSDVWGKPERKQILSRGKEQSHRGGVRFKNGFITLFYFFSCFLSLSNAHNLIFSLSLSLSLSSHASFCQILFGSLFFCHSLYLLSSNLRASGLSRAHSAPSLSFSHKRCYRTLSLSLSLTCWHTSALILFLSLDLL